ncbi:hypothetical protein N7492_010349 [Penicillium capsulatum]|uniref:GPI anchored protein n=1 Tax=Penicillium capsulatum TaxID=69766 RepID=A0A9W9HR58_9EURO|nr:hypothetical protein N7492_010349 [Penicillium capsulatum]KAJ6112854.1 hypothetical protein N7512_008178 [Penicillium capsulatum]
MQLFALGLALLGLAGSIRASTIHYSTETGYFLQDETSTDASTFDYTAHNFGLINRTYPADRDLQSANSQTQWERFYHQVQKLNQGSPKNVEYKVLFLGRHGEGWHNAAESYYGTPAWNCYWAELNGNDTVTWHDASLTKAGETQALRAHTFWQSQITAQRIHTPDLYFVSPLTRTLQTANLTFTGLRLPKGSQPFHPLVKELFREGISIHTCDHRRRRSYIHTLFPDWPFEAGFNDDDELWNGVTAETSNAQDIRSRRVLGDIFFASSKAKAFVSVTSHSGEIASLLRVLGHREFKMSTGAVIPVLVRAERKEGESLSSSAVWTVSPHCTAPPVASTGSCICSASATPVTTLLVTGA